MPVLNDSRLNRRQFLIASAVTGAAALAAGATTVTWRELMQRAHSDPLAVGTRVLVVLTMYGGNDGLNTVIPYTDPAYHDARNELAYTADDVHPLADGLGLNPSMGGMAGLYNAGQLAIVRGVGYPNPDFSHFRSMDIWQTASPQEPIATGWIGRWLDATGDDPLRAVNIGAVLPPLAAGAKGAAAALPLGRTTTVPAAFATAITALGRTDPSDSPTQGLVCQGYNAERQVEHTFGALLNAPSNPDPDSQSAAGTGGGQGGLKQQLDLVARCVKAGVPTTVYSVSQGGFDTHADEKGTQAAQLGLVDAALTGFLKEMANDVHGRDVVVLVYSEFGRRVHANAAQGTDHGTAGPVFLAGVPVKGGMYGEEPSLTNTDQDDLKATVDFRTIYAELISKVLHADPSRILTCTQPEIGFLNT
jgi:uncharacterized protein (DUF1501 family)